MRILIALAVVLLALPATAETARPTLVVQRGHSAQVDCIRLSRDGSRVLTAGDNAAILWLRASGQELRRFEGHATNVTCADLSADGRWAASGGYDNTARAWDVATRTEVAHFAGSAQPIRAVAFASDGGVRVASVGTMADGSDRVARLWDASRGRPVRRFVGHGEDVRAVAVSADGQRLLTASHDKTARYWDADGGEPRLFKGHTEGLAAAALSADGRLAVTGSDDKTARVWDVASGRELRRLEGHAAGVHSVAISPDGRLILTADSRGPARLWEAASGREVATLAGDPGGVVSGGHPDAVYAAAFSPDGRSALVVGGFGEARLWDLAGRKRIRALQDKNLFAGACAFSADGRLLMTGAGAVVGTRDVTAHLWDVSSGRELRRFEGHSGNVTSGAFSPDGRFLLTGSEDRTARLWSVATGQELCRLLNFEDGTWVAVDPEGRFDTNNLDQIRGLHWILPDDPYHPLPLELFMRDYYEPRLLSRIMAGESLRPVRVLADLNRVQPAVRITRVEPGPGDAAAVAVTVEVTEGHGPQASGARDLHLFRDGQLVGSLAGNLPGGRATRTFTVRLPRRSGVRTVELSAYAFNVDRVKSLTDRRSVAVPARLTPRRGSAFIVAVGVNACQQAALDLRYAANDARRMLDVVGASLQAAGGYDEVVRVPLIADHAETKGARAVTTAHATRGMVRAVLDRLAGRPGDAALLPGIPGADRLRAAQPEDLVLLFFSCHGYADADGAFYFVPFDCAAPTQPGFLKTCISSDDLSDWLRDVDAGDTVLVADACHSAATVDAADFRPGPMGSRGLGQMAYDKGMRILAATQADDVALESELIRQGLLAYALTRDALEAGQADSAPHDGRITLQEWLGYTVSRVPTLYREVQAGHVQSFGRAVRNLVVTERKRKRAPFQVPALFDFSKGRADVVVRGR